MHNAFVHTTVDGAAEILHNRATCDHTFKKTESVHSVTLTWTDNDCQNKCS